MIKILGVASGKENETITQATFIENLIKFMSEDPMGDRDKLKRGKKLSGIDNPLQKKQIFRNMFVHEEDAVIQQKDFFEVFKKIKIKDKDFNPEVYKPGSSGASDLYKDLLRESGIKE